MHRDDRRERRARQQKRIRRQRRNRALLTAGTVVFVLALVIGAPWLLTRVSLHTVLDAAGAPAAATAAPTLMPLWTARPAAATPTPSPTPQPTSTPESVREGIDPSGKMIALTFDDGPGAKTTGRILDALKKAGGHATFFMLGENAAAHPELAQRVIEEGNQIGSHTNSHKSLIRLTRAQMVAEVDLSLDNIEKAAGARPTILRPPYGNVNDKVKAALDIPLINWSVDTLDWKSRDAKKVYKHILENVRDGDIILMHDIYDSTALAVEKVVPALVKKGYQLVTVSELFACKGLALEAGNVYFSAR